MNEENNNEGNKIDENTGEETSQDFPLPTPSLMTLVSGLAAQVMVAAGIIPNPVTGKSTFLLNQAQHLIETIVMLDEKTKGNQTADETEKIQNVLHELRMLFVASQKEKERRTAG
jgi:hypothetical protein